MSPLHFRDFPNAGPCTYIDKMGLRCLVLTSDATLLETMRHSFDGTKVHLELRTDAASAMELSARRRLDSFVIDCDDVPGAHDVLTNIRRGRSNKLSVVFVVVNATSTVDAAFDRGANFVLSKPVRQELLRGYLDIAVGRMEHEHRRYFRHRASLPVQLSCRAGRSFAGQIMNVSEGGLALTHFAASAIEGLVTVQFGLPSVEPQNFQARAEVVWNDAYAAGLRFVTIDPACRSAFAAWLDSLEAQLQFRESIQSDS